MTTNLQTVLEPPFTIASRSEGDEVTLTLEGEIDLASVSVLERELHETERFLPRRIVLDLASLDFIDSAGVHLLFQAQERADSNGHLLVLARVPAQAQRLFRLTGLDTRIVIQ